jgi:folate-binding protein YgfZ
MSRIAFRPRAYVRIAGPDAADYLERMLSNEVENLDVGDSREALLLTPKARLIAPLRVWRRGDEDFLLLTEPELGEAVLAQLLRMRLRARCEIEPEQHTSHVVLDRDEGGIANDDYGVPAVEVLDAELEPTLSDDEVDALRIRAGTPRWGRELDDRVLPAEAGLDVRAISFSKGCYPGQEPIARLHYRGHVNRALRVLELDGVVEPGGELTHDGKSVGRVTSVADRIALAYVRAEVPEDAELQTAAGTKARLHLLPARP